MYTRHSNAKSVSKSIPNIKEKMPGPLVPFRLDRSMMYCAPTFDDRLIVRNRNKSGKYLAFTNNLERTIVIKHPKSP